MQNRISWTNQYMTNIKGQKENVDQPVPHARREQFGLRMVGLVTCYQVIYLEVYRHGIFVSSPRENFQGIFVTVIYVCKMRITRIKFNKYLKSLLSLSQTYFK